MLFQSFITGVKCWIFYLGITFAIKLSLKVLESDPLSLKAAN